MIVVDTSAVVAALSGEPDRARVNATLAENTAAVMSAANYLECGIVLVARFGDAGVHDLRLYLHEAGVEVAPVDRDQTEAALDAWMRFGKGRHRAGLNFGDCFAYSLASLRDAALLFVGEDFRLTDVRVA